MGDDDLVPSLPRSNSLDRINQHEDVQQQIVPYREQENQFNQRGERDRSGQAKPARNENAENAGEDISDGIENRISYVSDGDRLRAVTLNDDGRIFDCFPEHFCRQSDGEFPDLTKHWKQEVHDSKEQEPVSDVRERVGIEEMLGIVRAIDVAGPEADVSA